MGTRGIWRARTACTVGFLTVCAGATFIGGCFPNEMPAFTADGKTVVALAGGGSPQLWVCDVASGNAAPRPLPDPLSGSALRARAVGDHVWLEGTRRGEGGDLKCFTFRFDPSKNEFAPCPPGLEENVMDAIPGSCEAGKCLFVEGADGFDVFTYPELKKLKSVSLGEARAAGNFWWIEYAEEKTGPGEPKAAMALVLRDPEGKRACTISAEEAGALGKRLHYARVSNDGEVVLLAQSVMQGPGSYLFGLFDTHTGKFLWGGQTTGECLTGTPLIKRDQVWTVELVPEATPVTGPGAAPASRPAREVLGLVRYSPAAEGGQTSRPESQPARRIEQTGRREVVGASDAEGDIDADRFTPSPDGSQFVVCANGEPPRLVFIPIRKGVTAKDVRVIELTGSK